MGFSFVDVKQHRYGRDREPEECPLCHFAIHPEEVTWAAPCPYGKELFVLEIVYKCPRVDCGRFFIARYERRLETEDIGRRDLYLFESVPSSPPLPQIPEEVMGVSPSFLEIYAQSIAAENYGLHEIAGVGYRKALEYLVKDYCISVHKDKKEEIKSAWLGTCIKNFVDSSQVKICAERAAWLGNDETHYIRKWPDKDINNLKELIVLTINWVHSSLLTKKYEGDMK